MTDENNNGKSFMILIGIFVGLIAIGLVIGILRNSGNEVVDNEFYEYNGFTFTKSDTLWQTTVFKYNFKNESHAAVQEIPFFANYGPRDVENISIEADVSQIANQTKNLVLTFDPTFGQSISLAGIEIGKVLVSFYGWQSDRIIVGVNSINDTSGFPYFDCNNATNGTKVINYNFGNETKVVQTGDCYEIFAEEHEDIIKASDLIMYQLLGIIKN